MWGSWLVLFVCFFSSRRRHTRCLSDWSSDVCSSDLLKTGFTPRPRFSGPFSLFQTFPSDSFPFSLGLQQDPERLAHTEEQRLELEAAAHVAGRERGGKLVGLAGGEQ